MTDGHPAAPGPAPAAAGPTTFAAALALRHPGAGGGSLVSPVAELVLRGALAVQAGPPRRTLGVRRAPRYAIRPTDRPALAGAPLATVHAAVVEADAGAGGTDVRDVARRLGRSRLGRVVREEMLDELQAAGLVERVERSLRADAWVRTPRGDAVVEESQAALDAVDPHGRPDDPTPEQIAAAGVLADGAVLLALYDAWVGPGSGAEDEARLLKHAGLSAPLRGRGDLDAAVRTLESHLGTLDGLAALHAVEGGATGWTRAFIAALPPGGGGDNVGAATAGASA